MQKSRKLAAGPGGRCGRTRVVIKLWKASRPYSYPAAIVPVLLGTAASKFLFPTLDLRWGDFILVLLGCILAQAISNLVNDLVDFKLGIDTPDAPGRKSALISGDLSYDQMLQGTIAVCAAAALIGAYFSIVAGLPVVTVIAVGAVLSVEYTAPPLKLKYRGLGDLSVFIAFGIAMVFGAYMVQTRGQAEWLSEQKLVPLLLLALPSAFLVTAILQVNNHRDREKDAKLGGKTVANILSVTTSRSYLSALVILPYAIICGLIAFRVVELYAALILLTIPLAAGLLKKVSKSDFNGILPMAARLHGQFGVLFAFALVLQIHFSR